MMCMAAPQWGKSLLSENNIAAFLQFNKASQRAALLMRLKYNIWLNEKPNVEGKNVYETITSFEHGGGSIMVRSCCSAHEPG